MNFNSKIFENNKNISLDNFINKALYDLELGEVTRNVMEKIK